MNKTSHIIDHSRFVTSSYSLSNIDRDPAVKTAKPSLIFSLLAFSTLENGKRTNIFQGQLVSLISSSRNGDATSNELMTIQLSYCVLLKLINDRRYAAPFFRPLCKLHAPFVHSTLRKSHVEHVFAIQLLIPVINPPPLSSAQMPSPLLITARIPQR